MNRNWSNKIQIAFPFFFLSYFAFTVVFIASGKVYSTVWGDVREVDVVGVGFEWTALWLDSKNKMLIAVKAIAKQRLQIDWERLVFQPLMVMTTRGMTKHPKRTSPIIKDARALVGMRFFFLGRGLR